MGNIEHGSAQHPATTRGINIQQVAEWKLALLDHVARTLSDQGMPELQEKVGVWTQKKQPIYPSNEQIVRLDNGCLNFSIWAVQDEVVFSMWITHGEVRFGVKIPSSLLVMHSPLYDRICRAWDGKNSQREETIENHIFFDWIWRDATFANFEFMVESTRDELKSAILADRLASLAIHIYLSVYHALSDEYEGKVFTSKPEPEGTEYFVDLEGDVSALEYLASRHGLLIRETEAIGEFFKVTVYVPYGKNPPACGAMQDPDGGMALVLSVTKKKAPKPSLHMAELNIA